MTGRDERTYQFATAVLFAALLGPDDEDFYTVVRGYAMGQLDRSELEDLMDLTLAEIASQIRRKPTER